MKVLQDILINKRKELNLSLRDAGQLIGISHSYLSSLEKGTDPRTNTPIKPTPETLNLISKAYNIEYDILMETVGYIEKRNSDTKNSYTANIKSDGQEEKYAPVDDIEEAMKIILEQPGLMLKGSILSDESKIILANAIQMGLRTAEELEKKKNEGDSNE